MNLNCYKIIFSKRLGTLVAVGEHTSSTGKAASGQGCRSSVVADGFVGALRFTFASVALACLSLGNTQAQSSPIATTALPQGGSVSTGSATISTQGAAMAITQATDKASINWQSFNVGTGASVNIAQPSADAVLLNRVVGNDPSQILGKLSANGQVILLNPNGVLFGKDGSVTASAFTASTFGLSDADFMAGYYKYNRNGSTAAVVNQGTIETSAGGFVALIGATVTNEGTIHAPQGDVVMAAAESVTLPEELVKPQPVTTPNTVSVRMSKRVRLELDPAAINTAVKNTESGVIVTEGGQVLLQAAALSSAVASVTHSGRIDTSAPQAGAVTVLADNNDIKVNGSIKANSSGTDNQGQARTGGDIIIGRDVETGVLAKIADVSGAVLESDKGFVETSGEHLATQGIKVKAADWLLDPNNIEINLTNTAVTAGNSVVLAGDIASALDAGTNVTIATGNGVGSTSSATGVSEATPGTGNSSTGTIVVNSAITSSYSGASNPTLKLSAASNITVSAAINTSGSNVHLLSTGGSITTTAAITARNVSIDNTGGTIDASTGVITKGASTGTSATGISIGANITATGNLNMYGLSTSGYGINVLGNKALSGANIQAIGQTTNGAYGVHFNGSNSVITTGSSGDSLIKGMTTAGGTNALLAWGGLGLTAASGTTLTLWGDGKSTGDRAARFDGGVSTNGAVTLKGTSTNATSLMFINGAVTANANSALTLSGTTSASSQSAVYFVNNGGVALRNGATVNITGHNTTASGAGTGVLIQGGGIYKAAGATSAGAVTITGSVSSGTAGSTGVSVQAGISTDGNLDIQGNVASASSTGVSITNSGSVESKGASANITIGSNYSVTNAGYIKATGATGTGSNINLTSTNNSISGTGTIGDTTNKNASVTFTQAGTSTYDGAINAANFTKAGTGALTLDSWAQTPSVLTNISNAYTVKDGGSLTINTFGLNYPQLNPASVNVENASTFSLNSNSNGFWKSTAFNFTGGLGGGTLNLVGNPVGTSSTTNTFSTSGGATNTITGLLNANSANVNLTLNAATSGTTLSDGSYAALAFTTNVQGGYGIDNASTITISGGGGVLFKDKIRATALNINAGTLQMGDGSAITAATTPDLNATNVGIASGAKLIFNRPDTHTNTSTISGAGELIKTGSGTTILTGDNTYSGTTTISAGTLQIGNDTTTGTLGTGAVINNASLEFKRSANTLVSNNITGTGDLLATLSAGGLKFSGDVALDGDIDLTASHATDWHGIQLSGNLSAAGDINLTGASNTRYGILIDAFKSIQTTGNAPQSVVMTGNAANSSTTGIAIIGAVNTQNGSTLLATGTNTGGGNGIYNELTTGGTNYGKIGSATSGDITLIGTSSGGSAATAINTDLALNQGHALLLRGDITSKGHISLTGTADNGLGVFLQHSTYDYGRTMAEAQPTIQVVSGGANMAGQSAISISGTNLGSNPFSNNGVLIGSKIINNSTGGATTITSQEGGVALVTSTTGITTGSGTITNASTAGAITITAGDGTAASTASVGDVPSSISIGNSVTRAWTLSTAGTQITQNSNAGVTITSDGLGNVTPAKIINNGTGDVVIGAGIQIAAGTATGGNVLTASGNTLTQASTGKTYVYTGSASGTGALANLSSNFNTLFYAGNTGTINTAFNKAYNSTIAGGPNSQALFRQSKGPSYALNFNSLSKTYGDVDPTNLNATFLADYLANGGGTNISQAIAGTAGSNTFASKTADIFNDLTITRAIGTDAGTYAYTMTGNTLINGITGSTSLVIVKRNITLTGITASNKTYDGSTAATVTSGTFSNLVAGEALLLSGVGAFSDANVGNGKTVTANAALLNKADSTGKWANYNLTTSGNVTGLANITPAALTITVNGSSAFVTQDPNSAFNQGFGYAGFVNGETASTALTALPTRTYIGAANPSVGTYANAYDLTAIPQAANGNYTITVQKGTLNVVAADALMLTVASQSQVYGALTAANEAVPAQGTVTAQYCLVQANCNGGNLVNLNLRKDTTTPNQWIISDNTSSTVQFGLTLTGASYSTGGFVQVGNYDYSLSAASPMVIGTQNFNTVVANTGSLGVTPLAVTLRTTPVTKTYDGNTTLPSTTLSASNTAASDDLQVSFIAGEFGSSTVSSAAAFSLYGVTLAGNDIANYSMANYTNSTYLGTGSITKSGGGNNTKPQPIHPPKPIIPTNNTNGGESGGGESGGSSAGNPYLLVPNNRNNSADRCTPNTLEDCLCETQEPKPVEGLAICYQPKKTASSATSKSKRS